jgi:hypothetical protein
MQGKQAVSRWSGAIAFYLGTSVVPPLAQAAGLGIPLDGFIGTFETFVVGLGLAVGLVGLTGYVGSLMDNPFSNILAGSVGFFTKAGLLGGGTALLGLVGLVGGATL